MILYIDTSVAGQATFGFGNGGKIKRKTYVVDFHHSHQTLEKLEIFLKQNKISITHPKINQIMVSKGPGSYTGVRVGVTIAQALGFAWHVSVKAVAKEKFKISIYQN